MPIIYKGRMDLWFHLSAIIMLLTSIVAVLMSLNEPELMIMVVITFGLVDTLMLSVYLKYRYLMEDTYFIGCFSFMNFKVPYKNIIMLESIVDKSFNMSASKYKIKITCLVKGKERVLYVSPVNEEAFIEIIIQKNPNIKIIK